MMGEIKTIEGPLPQYSCTCNGRCSTCVDAVGMDDDIVCPYCPVHGEGAIARLTRCNIIKGLE